MNIYKISQQEISIYRGIISNIVIANSELSLRKIVSNCCGSEGDQVWWRAEVELLGTYSGEETVDRIVMRQYL